MMHQKPFQVDLTAPGSVASFPEPAHDTTNPAVSSLPQYWISPWKYGILVQSTSKHTSLANLILLKHFLELATLFDHLLNYISQTPKHSNYLAQEQ